MLFFFFLIFKSRPLSKGCYAFTDFWKKGPQAAGLGGKYPAEDTVVGSFMSP